MPNELAFGMTLGVIESLLRPRKIVPRKAVSQWMAEGKGLGIQPLPADLMTCKAPTQDRDEDRTEFGKGG